MKTIGELIEAQKRCATYPNCHFCFLHAGPLCTWIRDVLVYLKEYRELLDNAENEPLDFAELKLMEGKPVWVELQDEITETVDAFWCLCIRVGHLDVKWMDCIASNCLSYTFMEEDYGKTWQAYRKERKNG